MIEILHQSFYIIYNNKYKLMSQIKMKNIQLHIGSMISPMGIGLGQHLPENLRHVL